MTQIATSESKILGTPNDALAFLKTPSLSQNFLALGQGQSEAVMASVVRSGEFYLQQPEKERCIPVGTFDKRGGKLRGQLDLVYGGWRSKAILLVDSQVMLQSYNTNDPQFRKIVGTQEVKKGNGPKAITPMFGTEILVYLPEHMFDWPRILANTGSSWDSSSIAPFRERFKRGCIASFFFAKTNKEFSPAGEYTEGTPFMLRSDIKETAKFSWWLTPDRSTLNVDDSNKEWIEYGRGLLAENLAAFVAPMSEKAETVLVDEGTAAGGIPAPER